MKKLILIACSLLLGYGGFAQSANDAGVNAITSPNSPVAPGVSLPVSVTVKNYGNSPLTSATLGFSVNGVVQPTFAWSGFLSTNGISAAVTIGNVTFSPGNHTVKAWSKLPNGAADANATNDTTTIQITTCTTLSGNYTIDKNVPASASNFTSISAAARALANCGVSGPVTLSLTGGPYTEAVTFTSVSGASVTNTITINGNGNTLINPGTTGDALKLDGATYFRFNNLKVESHPGTTGGAVVSLVNGALQNNFTGCAFTHSTAITTASWVVNLQPGSRYNMFLNNTIIGANYGIFNSGNTANPGNTNLSNQFIGNTIRDSYFTAVSCNNAPGTLIESNDISRPIRTNTSSFYGISIGSGCTQLTISRNRIHNTHDAIAVNMGHYVYGMYINSPGAAGSENIIKNNAIYNISVPSGSFQGINAGSPSNTYFYHNTISADNPAVTYGTIRGIYLGTNASNVRFINNNFSLSSPANNKHAIYIDAANISLVSNNNNLYVGASGNIGYYAFSNKATLADWKAVNSNAYDQQSVSAAPQFVNLATGNLKPMNPAQDNVGQAVPIVTEDITGAVRSTTAPDPGAYEFTLVANDAGITAIVSPASPVAPGVNTPVTVTLKNYGLSPLMSVSINWSVNNVPQPVMNWVGNLAYNQTMNVTVGNYTFPAGNHTLNICTSNPNGVADQNPDNDCQPVSLAACNALSGTYTINQNAGASATNFVSFASAVSTLTNCGISAPVTFNVVAGSGPYLETVTIGNINGTSATNTITFNGNANVLKSPAATADNVLILNGAKFIKFNNLKIEEHAAATTGSVVMLMNDAKNNTFENCSLTHSIITTNICHVVNIRPGCSNNTFQNNIITGAYYGIRNDGFTGLINDNNQFIGNSVKDVFIYAIYNIYSSNTLIEGNDITRLNRADGIVYYGIYITTGSPGVLISKNRIHDINHTPNGTVNGIYNAYSGTVGNENIVKNNVLYNFLNAFGTVIPIHNSGASHTFYYHNTISVDNPNVSFNNIQGLYFGAPVTNVKFINNIISLSSPSAIKHGVYLDAPTYLNIDLTSNYNDIYVPNGNVGFYAAAHHIAMANWQTANIPPFDLNSVSVDPQFISAATGNLRPNASGLNNLGQPLAAVTDDINGAPRNITNPDMGAVEFNVNQNDVGVVAISGPVTTGCGLTGAETVTVTIKNYGIATQTSVPVSYTLNAGTAVHETYTGSITAGATVTYSFNTKANMAASGTYTIVAQTNLAGDAVIGNNDTTFAVTNSLIPALPVAFDFETATTGISSFRQVINPNSNILESAAASYGQNSVKGLIMDGVDDPNWIAPAGVTTPWTSNPNHFSAVYLCISTAGSAATDTLILTFDLKQLFKAANTNTNFRVTANGTQVGPTYRPPFSGTPINWQKIEVDLSQFLNDPTIQIGLESSVKEAFDNGNGTANLLDNIEIRHIAGPTGPTGVNDNLLQSQVIVYPNPSTGLFNISLPKGKNYALTVSDLSGKVLRKQPAGNENNQLVLEGMAKGIYLLQISGENGSAVRKLIVE